MVSPKSRIHGYHTTVPSTAFASNHKKPDFERVFKNIKDIIPHDALSDHLGEYLDGKSSAEKLLYAIQNLRKKDSRKTPLTQLEMLEQLCEGVSQVLPKLDTDLITLTRQCTKLFDRIGRKLDMAVDDKFDDDKINQWYHMTIVVHILSGSGDNLTSLESHLGSEKDSETDPNSVSCLQIAAEVI
jgi:hypothetical protein